jgi:hypothetical protein
MKIKMIAKKQQCYVEELFEMGTIGMALRLANVELSCLGLYDN